MNPNRNPGWRAARAWLAIALIAACAALAGPPARAASFSTLEIATKNGVHIFSVEMATTEDEKSKGLMYRRELADGKGMLFDFSPEQQISMWMKNTYISLDMIFIRADGRILRIAENTEPESTKITCPVMPRLNSLHRKSAVSPTSAASVFLLSGAFSRATFKISVKPAIPRAANVLMGPAEIALTRIFLGPRSLAK